MPENQEHYSFSLNPEQFRRELTDCDEPILLFRAGEHTIYWLGIVEDAAFRCNIYLIKDGDEAILVDPGGKNAFATVYRQVEKLLPPTQLKGLVISHQDPDVSASMADWLQVNPRLQIIASPRIHVLLDHYQADDYIDYDIERLPCFRFGSGEELHFIPAPFLHSPGSFVTFDAASGFLFSSDIWAALDTEWQLVVGDFSAHCAKMDLFNKDYMASNRAIRGFLNRLDPCPVQAILPQHGSLMPQPLVADAYAYLHNLECGLDLLYPQLSLFPESSALAQPFHSEKSATGVVPEAVLTADVSGGGSEESALESLRPMESMAQALEQATRLAKLRDQTLRELKLAKQRLKESKARLAEAQAIAKLGHWEWNIDTGELVWSDEIYRMFGLEPQQFPATYEAFLRTVHPNDRRRVQRAVAQAVEEDIPYNINHLVVRPDGEIRQVHERAKIIRDGTGKPLRMFGTVQDITEMTQIEENLRSKSQIIKAIQQLQSSFISDSEPQVMYQGLLDEILELTGSEYGAFAETALNPEGEPFLTIYAMSSVPVSGPLRTLYEKTRDMGFEVHEFDNLFGAVLTSGKAVLCNDPVNDPRSLGFSLGESTVDSFMGIPIYCGAKQVGQVGLGNRIGGYDQELLEYLDPLLTACGQIILARHDRLVRRAAEKALAELAKLDGLLEIANRRSFDEYFGQQYRQALRRQSPLSLIMIDVDHFKMYNDYYGHQAGDKALKVVADVVREVLHRSIDMVARYGGEEFCCILPETPVAGALKVAEKIRAELAKRKIPHVVSPVADMLTVSMGVTTMNAGDNLARQDLLAHADQALYAAKAAGRSRIMTGMPE